MAHGIVRHFFICQMDADIRLAKKQYSEGLGQSLILIGVVGVDISFVCYAATNATVAFVAA
jgi:hypothetical protein